MAKTELTLVLPGLAAVLSQEINRSVLPKSLLAIVNKAHFEANSTGLTRILFNYFSQNDIVDSDLPVLSLAGLNGPALRADPCYLHADRDKLLLFAENLDLTEQESNALIAELQPLFDDMPAKLIQQTADNWLLQLDKQANVSFSALEEVNGQAVDAFLPVGQERKQWLRLWNEIQMQLYNSEVNQQRIADNKLPVNSVWFWGAGSFKAKPSAWTTVRGQSSLVVQLVQASSGVELIDDTAQPSIAFGAGQHLWLIDELDTESDWQSQLQHWEETLFRPLMRQVATRKISRLTLHIPELGRYQLTPLRYWKFW